MVKGGIAIPTGETGGTIGKPVAKGNPALSLGVIWGSQSGDSHYQIADFDGYCRGSELGCFGLGCPRPGAGRLCTIMLLWDCFAQELQPLHKNSLPAIRCRLFRYRFRMAHNLKVIGSNPVPATKKRPLDQWSGGVFFLDATGNTGHGSTTEAGQVNVVPKKGVGRVPPQFDMLKGLVGCIWALSS
jgi:hypothetical protein